MEFHIVAECSTTKARSSKMKLSHYVVDTPQFMPVGTSGCVKGITTQQLRDLDCHIILGNTYHLALQPGMDLLNEMGGLHKFMGWDRGMLTDSGGFQMVSLLKLSQVTENGVTFISPFDNITQTVLTPEMSIAIQNAIGADIIMQLDDVVSSTVTGPRVEEAMWRSIRWLDRCIAAHKNTATQNLFPIIQGGLDPDLRKACIQEMVKRNLNGHAIGGLSGGEAKDSFWKIVSLCTDLLPKDKPRYCMGVGYSEDLVVCVALGVDMFDCVYPTRTARFGTALTRKGPIRLKAQEFEYSTEPIETNCACLACTQYSKGQISRLVRTKETVGFHLLSIHNISYQMKLMAEIRSHIEKDSFVIFVQQFMVEFYDKKYPKWVVDALMSVGIILE